MLQNENASLDLIDIIRGFSVFTYLEKKFFFKHFLVMDFIALDIEQAEGLKASKKSGILTEKELISNATRHGAWSTAKEENIKSLQWMIKKSTTALGKISDPTQRRVFKGQIDGQEKELKEAQLKRRKITSYSAEHLAELKRVKKVFDQSVFCDQEFKEKPPQDLEIVLTTLLFSRYNELMQYDRVLEASYFGGFFELFSAQHGNSVQLLDTSFHKITIFQKTLLVLSNSLLNKMKNTQIPDEIYGDPVKMFNYEEKNEGGDKKVSHGADDLKKKMKARGGELKPEDFLS
tara:strand:- start:83 stop:952 length:870 start_codon:yes stop_codon:yes gene_type:complete